MSGSDTGRSIETELLIDEACAAFESTWQQGCPRPIETFLDNAALADRRLDLICELVATEVELRSAAGEAPSIDEYRTRFPEVELEGVFAEVFVDEEGTSFGGIVQAAGAPSDDLALQNRRADLPHEPPEYPRIEGYEILEELGRGAVGVVYKARDRRLKRTVAIKLIASGVETAQREHERLKQEAESIARLQHPNIVQIFEVGEHSDRPYLVLEYVSGGGLHRHIDGKAQSARHAAAVVEKLARAVDYAHHNGIVHRDLKPANILLESSPRASTGSSGSSRGSGAGDSGRDRMDLEPKITDFGLAKQLDSRADLTRTGIVLGTPSYMAPEQASSRQDEVGPTADVYALGAILYELLTGRPPFMAATYIETLRMVREEEAVSPRRLQPSLARDIETICLKCLSKAPNRRYESAADLAEDCRRFLNGLSITARRPSPAEQALKWACRRPAAAALIAVSVLAAILVTWQWHGAVRLRREGQAKLAQAHLNEWNGSVQEGAGLGALVSLARARRAERDAFAGKIFRKHDHLFRTRAAATLAQSPQLASMWFPKGGARLAQMSPNGRRILVSPREDVARLHEWTPDGKSAQTLLLEAQAWQARFSADGELIATLEDDGSAKVYRTEDGRRIARVGDELPRSSGLDFSPDGSRLAVVTSQDIPGPGQGDGPLFRHLAHIRVWEVKTGERILDETLQVTDHQSDRPYVSFTADGEQIFCPSARGPTLFSLDETREDIQIRSFPASDVHRHSGDRDLVLGAALGQVSVWSISEAKRIREHRIQRYAHFPVYEFSPDGSTIAFMSDPVNLVLWDFNADQTMQRESRRAVQTLAFSPCGRYLALAQEGHHDVRIELARSGRLATSLIQHHGLVTKMEYGPEGRYLLTACDDGAVYLWDLAPAFTAPLDTHGGVNAICYSPDGTTLVTGGQDGSINLWGANTGELRDSYRQSKAIVSLSVSRDGRYLFAASDEIRVWDTRTGQSIFQRSLCRRDGPHNLKGALSPDGRTVLIDRSFREGEADSALIDLQSGDTLLELPGMLRFSTFSPDGKLLLNAIRNNCHVLDIRSGKELGCYSPSLSYVSYVGFAEDSKHGICALQDGELYFFDTESLTTRFRVRCGAVADAKSPPGAGCFVTGSECGEVHVFDTVTGELRIPPLTHGAAIRSIDMRSFDDSGSTPASCLLSAGSDGILCIWNTETGLLVAPPLRSQAAIIHAEFRPGGTQIASLNLNGDAEIWPFPVAGDISSDGVEALCELLGQPIVPEHPSDDSSHHELWARFQAQSGDCLSRPVVSMQLWHERQLRLAEAAADWWSARHHLDRLTAIGSDEDFWSETIDRVAERLNEAGGRLRIVGGTVETHLYVGRGNGPLGPGLPQSRFEEIPFQGSGFGPEPFPRPPHDGIYPEEGPPGLGPPGFGPPDFRPPGPGPDSPGDGPVHPPGERPWWLDDSSPSSLEGKR